MCRSFLFNLSLGSVLTFVWCSTLLAVPMPGAGGPETVVAETAAAYAGEPESAVLESSVPPGLPELPTADLEVEILNRGPVHEAFAEQVGPDPTEGIVTEVPPPELIDEIPPDERPEGDNIQWIPGYWFWDEERNDYLWVSGTWRRAPIDREWVPGYWQEIDAGHQWISGFWSSEPVEDLSYFEMPPESLELGASSPAPSSDYFWRPGIWARRDGAFRWTPGNWCRHRQGWTWVVPRYVWTPRGCVFVPGYWDYSLTARGYLFAPAFFPSALRHRYGYRYRPTCWIGYDSLLMHLFVRPSYHHLYFGDYYADRYRSSLYTPCYSYHARHVGYSSLYVYYQTHYRRQGIDYCGRVRDWHNYYATHATHRPAHTYRHQIERQLIPATAARHRHELLGHSYGHDTHERLGGRRLVPVTSQMSASHRNQVLRIDQARDRRRQVEVGRRVGDPLAPSTARTRQGDAIGRRGPELPREATIHTPSGDANVHRRLASEASAALAGVDSGEPRARSQQSRLSQGPNRHTAYYGSSASDAPTAQLRPAKTSTRESQVDTGAAFRRELMQRIERANGQNPSQRGKSTPDIKSTWERLQAVTSAAQSPGSGSRSGSHQLGNHRSGSANRFSPPLPTAKSTTSPRTDSNHIQGRMGQESLGARGNKSTQQPSADFRLQTRGPASQATNRSSTSDLFRGRLRSSASSITTRSPSVTAPSSSRSSFSQRASSISSRIQRSAPRASQAEAPSISTFSRALPRASSSTRSPTSRASASPRTTFSQIQSRSSSTAGSATARGGRFQAPRSGGRGR